MTVTFCGHSELTASDTEYLRKRVAYEIEKLILRGANEFFLGGYGDFDKLCAKSVRDLKIKYPNIKSVLVIPYLDRQYSLDIYDDSLYPLL